MRKQCIDDIQLVAKLTAGRSGKLKSYVAVLLVSVGKENFEGKAIESAIKMINKEFSACCIVVADTLQRHNIATENEISTIEAYKESLVQGNMWIQRNTPYFLNSFTIPYEIIRWDNLINDTSFAQKEKDFTSFISESMSFSTAMKKSIDEYGIRLLKHLGEEHFERISDCHEASCFSYLKEECVALTILPKKISIGKNKLAPYVIVYPGKSTAILTENHNVFIKKEFHGILQNFSDFLNWIPYRFSKVKIHDNGINLVQSLNSKMNRIKVQSEISILKQIELINSLSKAQLRSFESLFDDYTVSEFKHHLLSFLLNNSSFSFEQNSLMSREKLFSIQSIAYVFGNQLLAIFNTLEQKHSNKCKANMVRILKEENKPGINTIKLLDVPDEMLV